MLLCLFKVMIYCMKYLCVGTLKPLYALFVRDLKHTWNRHINTLVCSLPRLKYNARKFVKNNLFLLTNRYDLTVIFQKYMYCTYQIANVSLNVPFNMTTINIQVFKMHYDVIFVLIRREKLSVFTGN